MIRQKTNRMDGADNGRVKENGGRSRRPALVRAVKIAVHQVAQDGRHCHVDTAVLRQIVRKVKVAAVFVLATALSPSHHPRTREAHLLGITASKNPSDRFGN
jgi:hypothetical protein